MVRHPEFRGATSGRMTALQLPTSEDGRDGWTGAERQAELERWHSVVTAADAQEVVDGLVRAATSRALLRHSTEVARLRRDDAVLRRDDAVLRRDADLLRAEVDDVRRELDAEQAELQPGQGEARPCSATDRQAQAGQAARFLSSPVTRARRAARDPPAGRPSAPG